MKIGQNFWISNFFIFFSKRLNIYQWDIRNFFFLLLSLSLSLSLSIYLSLALSMKIGQNFWISNFFIFFETVDRISLCTGNFFFLFSMKYSHSHKSICYDEIDRDIQWWNIYVVKKKVSLSLSLSLLLSPHILEGCVLGTTGYWYMNTGYGLLGTGYWVLCTVVLCVMGAGYWCSGYWCTSIWDNRYWILKKCYRSLYCNYLTYLLTYLRRAYHPYEYLFTYLCILTLT